MRSIWKGAISFGLVNVPVKLYSATEDHDLSLHQVHDADGGRIRYQRRCEVCGKVVEYAHIDKAYDDGNTTVVLTERGPEVPAGGAEPGDRGGRVRPAGQVDPIMFDRSYFLEPDKTAQGVRAAAPGPGRHRPDGDRAVLAAARRRDWVRSGCATRC